jgi:hypothetical protein
LQTACRISQPGRLDWVGLKCGSILGARVVDQATEKCVGDALPSVADADGEADDRPMEPLGGGTFASRMTRPGVLVLLGRKPAAVWAEPGLPIGLPRALCARLTRSRAQPPENDAIKTRA